MSNVYYFDEEPKDAVKQVAKSVEGKMVYLHSGERTRDTGKGRHKELCYSDYKKEIEQGGVKGRRKQTIVRELEEAYNRNMKPDDVLDPVLQKVYGRVKDVEDRKDSFQSESPLFPVVSKEERPSIFYICGGTGSGKSYLAKRIIEQYKKDFPKNQVYLISQLDRDKTLDDLKYIKRLDVETFYDDPISFKEFKNCLCLFDDFEVYEETDKPLFKEIIGLMNGLMTMGRHQGVSTIICQHRTSNYKATRLALLEANWYVMYPAGASERSMKYLFHDYGGLGKETVKELKKSKSRYVCLYRHCPNFILTEHDIHFV